VGHLAIDEMSDHQLFGVVQELKSSVKRLALETKMFEGVFCGNFWQINHIIINSFNI
jgi:hypothetical protein